MEVITGTQKMETRSGTGYVPSPGPPCLLGGVCTMDYGSLGLQKQALVSKIVNEGFKILTYNNRTILPTTPDIRHTKDETDWLPRVHGVQGDARGRGWAKLSNGLCTPRKRQGVQGEPKTTRGAFAFQDRCVLADAQGFVHTW